MCGFTVRYVRPCSRIGSPRKQVPGSERVESLDLFSLRCHCSKNLLSDDSRRPWGICPVGPCLVHTFDRRTEDNRQVLEFTEIRSWNFGKFIIIRKYRLEQIDWCGNWSRSSSPCVAERRACLGVNGRAIAKKIGKPHRATFMQTLISDTVRPLVSRICWTIPPLTSACARHPPCPTRDQY